MSPQTLNFEGKTLVLRRDKVHGYSDVILLKNGTIGRRERSMYPDWWRDFYHLKTENGLVRFHIDEIEGVYEIPLTIN